MVLDFSCLWQEKLNLIYSICNFPILLSKMETLCGTVENFDYVITTPTRELNNINDIKQNEQVINIVFYNDVLLHVYETIIDNNAVKQMSHLLKDVYDLSDLLQLFHENKDKHIEMHEDHLKLMITTKIIKQNIEFTIVVPMKPTSKEDILLLKMNKMQKNNSVLSEIVNEMTDVIKYLKSVKVSGKKLIPENYKTKEDDSDDDVESETKSNIKKGKLKKVKKQDDEN